ncbi:hypothetical protein HDU85_007588 [Gaertneriomyces sp. JEL0708]|nr:hypothetical protein HDU85_007588 [Gaertneriomyces sp. JEL0708]
MSRPSSPKHLNNATPATNSPPINKSAATAITEAELKAARERIAELEAQLAHQSVSRHEKPVNGHDIELKNNDRGIEIERHQQGRTNSSTSVDHDELINDSFSSLNSFNAAPRRTTVRAPERFSLELKPGQRLTDKGNELNVFLDRFNLYVRAIRLSEQRNLSIEAQIIEVGSLVCNDVFESIMTVKRRIEQDGDSITSVEELFIDVLTLCAESEMEIALELDNMKQNPGETVEAFFYRFDRFHTRAMKIGLIGRHMAILRFVNALKPAISRQLRIAVNVHGLIANIVDVKLALRKCFVAAKAYETEQAISQAEKKTSERPNWRGASNSNGSQSNNQQRPSNPSNNTSSKDDRLNHFSRKYNMSIKDVELHLANGKCFICHDRHTVIDCPQRSARFNMTQTQASNDDSIDDESQSKNE